MTAAAARIVRLEPDEWRGLEAAHHARTDALTAGHRERAGRGEKHPVWDFLFQYYSYKPKVLRRWHPGAGVELAGAADTERSGWRWYRAGSDSGSLAPDVEGFVARNDRLVRLIRVMLARTASRPGLFDCFGLHEWAMVYRDEEHRHPQPLRLGQAGTDAVVESHELRCTHYDAFRFFTPEAEPLNRTRPTRESQPELDQPGCLHAGMDVYKWAIKLGPLVPGELLLDCFELAADIRCLDMEAAPYDLTAWGFEPVRIETTEGKADYVRRQRAFADRSNRLRERVLDAALARVPEPAAAELLAPQSG
ncbi:3-methyladenine DNA glycosylase [Microbacterium halophytorum]|uniref:3-methyladenine DNA glycosylase n=1 Tax=Microbacterium halophytorum TaxID=2067568 RepID=UPI001574ACEB|nr:3-methyladenine DNA glycosylase [Microbacterium halophytorum]